MPHLRCPAYDRSKVISRPKKHRIVQVYIELPSLGLYHVAMAVNSIGGDDKGYRQVPFALDRPSLTFRPFV